MSKAKMKKGQVAVTGLSNMKINECESIFKFTDENKEGYNSLSSLGDLLRGCGVSVTEKELNDITNKFQAKIKKNEFNLHQYIELFQEVYEERESVEDLIKAFQFWDKDKSGRVAREDIERALSTLGDVLTQKELDYLLKEADPHNTGRIDYVKYAHLLMKGNY